MWTHLPNGGIERQIKRYLHNNGYQRGRYRLTDIELIAIERPGWKQIFRFLVETNSDQGHKVYTQGIVFDDERRGQKFLLTSNQALFQQTLLEWSEGMIQRKTSQHDVDPVGMLLVVVGMIVVFLSLIVMTTG